MSLVVSLLLCVSGPVIVVGPGSGASSARALLLPIEVGYVQARQVPVLAAAEVVEAGGAGGGCGAAAGPKQLLGAMEAAYAGVKDYTATLLKQERVKGKLLPRETIQVKFRKPFSIYMKWTGSEKAGQEVLYVRGRNDGQMRAHPGSFPDVTVSLKPGSGLAMRGNRHPITEASLGDVLALMLRDLKRSEARPQDGVTLTDLGEETRFGARVRCVEGRFPADGYYAPRLRICVFVASKLLSRVQAWDAGDRLVEDYEYRDLRVNVGLRDRDFAEDNPAYKF
ncbi:MAG: DUF1571 domain-containing protein [Nannocystis sp.]|uniref:DUF1571 domain-containing protein n=1 Tax=Nannocystis sp. TaxID=1962667 RepID=UPI002427B7A9|nr:DUF1571 domain-containing protein [Nannocystis sp.]MBK9756318.1 DUF1571 domain-containing protein [Nannocystis sp.]